MITTQKNYTLQIFIVGLSALLLASLALVFGPKKSLILVGGLFITFFVFRDPKVGLALTLVAILNFSSKGKFTAGAEGIFVSAAKIMGFLTVVSWLFHHLTQRKKLVITRTMWLGFGFVVISFLSVVVAPDKKWALIDVFKLFIDYVLFFVIVNLISTTKQLKTFVLLLLLTGYISASAAIVQVKFPAFQMSGPQSMIKFGHTEGGIKDPQQLKSGSFVRPTGTQGHPNWLSLFLVTLLPLTLYCIKSPDFRKFRYYCFVGLILQLTALFMTHDRMAFLGIVFVFLLSIWFGLVRVTPLLISAACLGVFIVPFIVPATYLERVLSITQYKKSISISSRWELLVSGLDMIARYPLTGVGAGNYGIVLMRDYPDTHAAETVVWLRKKDNSTISDHSQAAHNLYVEVASETGLFGLAIYMTFLFGAAWNMYKLHRRGGMNELKELPLAFMISILAFSFIGIVLHAQLQKISWIVIAYSIILLEIAKKQKRLTTEST